ncbi:MAG: hypothetical protein E7G28_13120, partial [Cutibacterium avidum]|nr:hypothetical protein [Cutibacterium avidum]
MLHQDYELPDIGSIDLSALTEKIGTLAKAAGAIDPHEIEAVAQWARSFTTDRPDEHLARCRFLAGQQAAWT